MHCDVNDDDVGNDVDDNDDEDDVDKDHDMMIANRFLMEPWFKQNIKVTIGHCCLWGMFWKLQKHCDEKM